MKFRIIAEETEAFSEVSFVITLKNNIEQLLGGSEKVRELLGRDAYRSYPRHEATEEEIEAWLVEQRKQLQRYNSLSLKSVTVEASFTGSWNYSKNFEYPDNMPKDVWNIKNATLNFEILEWDSELRANTVVGEGNVRVDKLLQIVEINEELFKALYHFTGVNIPMA